MKKEVKIIKLSPKNEELFKKIVMDDKNCISIEQAITDAEKRWPMSK